MFLLREMIFEHPFYDNILFHTHVIFLLYISIILVFVQIPIFSL